MVDVAGIRRVSVQEQILQPIVALLEKRDVTRRRRRTTAAMLTLTEFIAELGLLRARMVDDAEEPFVKRGCAFTQLNDDELALLERQLALYVSSGQLTHHDSDDDIARTLLQLRVNHVHGMAIVSGDTFRSFARTLYTLLFNAAIRVVTSTAHIEQRSLVAGQIVAVLPWRAALIAGEVAHDRGVKQFWHLGCARDEETLVPTIYEECVPPAETRSWLHVICEPMLATGGTLAVVLERLRTRGVPITHVVIASAVAAPEGVDRLLSTHPDLRIVTGALDERLDANGYIAGPGLGDFGDLAMRDVDAAYAEQHWVRPGILTPTQAAVVLERTASLAQEHAATQ